jgi:hypothetical protein
MELLRLDMALLFTRADSGLGARELRVHAKARTPLTVIAKKMKTNQRGAPMNASTSSVDSRAEGLWLRYREQRELRDRLPDETTEEEQERARRELFAIEGALRADISESVNALACTIMIEIANETPEEIPGLHRAALAAIRSQLTGGIAEAAGRVLAQKTKERAPPGDVGVERERAENGAVFLWLDPGVVNRLKALREPGESYRDVILRLTPAAE